MSDGLAVSSMYQPMYTSTDVMPSTPMLDSNMFSSLQSAIAKNQAQQDANTDRARTMYSLYQNEQNRLNTMDMIRKSIEDYRNKQLGGEVNIQDSIPNNTPNIVTGEAGTGNPAWDTSGYKLEWTPKGYTTGSLVQKTESDKDNKLINFNDTGHTTAYGRYQFLSENTMPKFIEFMAGSNDPELKAIANEFMVGATKNGGYRSGNAQSGIAPIWLKYADNGKFNKAIDAYHNQEYITKPFGKLSKDNAEVAKFINMSPVLQDIYEAYSNGTPVHVNEDIIKAYDMSKVNGVVNPDKFIINLFNIRPSRFKTAGHPAVRYGNRQANMQLQALGYAKHFNED